MSELRKHLDEIRRVACHHYTLTEFSAAMDLLRASEAREKELLGALKAANEQLNALGDWLNGGDMAGSFFADAEISEEQCGVIMDRIRAAIASSEGAKP